MGESPILRAGASFIRVSVADTTNQAAYPHYRRLGLRRPTIVGVFVALVTLGSGVLNLLSVLGGPRGRPRWSAELFPLEFIHLSRTPVVLIGFALIISSLNIYRRKKRAWYAVVALAVFSAVFHLSRGRDYEEALFSLFLVAMLVATRHRFTVMSGAPALRSGVIRLLLSLAVAIGYGVAGFWLLDTRHFHTNFHLRDAVENNVSPADLYC
jgi:phosphatidylglycerol lysyltransferase